MTSPRTGSPTRSIGLVLLCGLFLLACSKAAGSTDAGPECNTVDAGHLSKTCANGLICQSYADGGDGRCGPCQLDNECALDEICTPGVQRCQLRHCFGHDCKVNDECQLGNFCVQGLCVSPKTTQTSADQCQVVKCAKNADCAAQQRCDLTNQVCVLNLGCASDTDCSANEQCNVAAGICQPACTAATAQDVCGLKLQCHEGRCVDCVANSDCGSGLTCNLTTNICQSFDSCVTNRDCAPPKSCNPRTKQCTATVPPCVSDDDCPTGDSCDLPTGACIPKVCQPDRFAPNSTLQTAAALPAGATENLMLCAHHVSYFSTALVNGDEFNVLAHIDPLLNFDVALLDGTGASIAESNYTVDAIVSLNGNYYIRTQSTDAYVPYGLQLSVTHGSTCHRDSDDPNNTYLQAAVETAGDVYSRAICPGEQKWYVISVNHGQKLAVELDTTALSGPLNLLLYDNNGTTLLDSSAQSVDVQTVSSTAFSGNRAFVQVVAADNATQNTYDLHFRLTGP